VVGGGRAGVRSQDSGFGIQDRQETKAHMRVAHIFAVSPFSTLDSRVPHEGGEFQIRLAGFWISDCPQPGTCRPLPTAYSLPAPCALIYFSQNPL
jgi:hypothetical protein